MEPRGPSGEDGHNPPESTPPPRRRLSMEEDMFYQHIMTSSQRRPSQPPTYLESDDSPAYSQGNNTDITNWGERRASQGDRNRDLTRVKSAGKSPTATMPSEGLEEEPDEEEHPGFEELPHYSSTIAIDGVFHKKHEIENTTKRAEDRQWHTVAVSLNGTLLSIYNTKKDWGWGKSRDGPSISPDNPPWVRRGKLEKTYSLLHADAGIAADYKKRRYVIRIRAEEDQFLLSCIELSTFVKWLECLFAAIDISAPLDERDFPRDMSVPRIQRIRWFRSQTGVMFPSTQQDTPDSSPPEPTTSDRRASNSSPPLPTPTPAPVRPHPDEQGVETNNDAVGPTMRADPFHRLSTSTYPHPSIDPHTGKWFPEHQWSTAHDLLYAKLCYSNLLFRSPRKSNYIVSKGKQWFVDWGTGRMVRVLPPAYGEIEYFGPWQVIHTENRRI